MKKIKFAGLKSYDNLGDQILIDTCKFLTDKGLRELQLQQTAEAAEVIDLLAPLQTVFSGLKKSVVKLESRIYGLLIRGAGIFLSERSSRILDRLYMKDAALRYRKYFRSCLDDCDALIFVGGAYLKYKGERFQYSIRLILKEAARKGIPVMLNAVGTEGYDDKDIRCRRLKEALNLPCVKVITTRDNADFLREHFVTDPSITAEHAADPALWIPECYDLQPIAPAYDVGINMTYLDLFSSYGIADDESFISLYRSLISELCARGLSFALFCNGKACDRNGAVLLAEKLGISRTLVFPQPKTPVEYLRQLQQFRCIIPLRLHAAISAFALGIPTTGFVWNHKIDYFLSESGQTDYFEDFQHIDCGKIADNAKMLAKKETGTFETMNKQKTADYLRLFLQDYLCGK